MQIQLKQPSFNGSPDQFMTHLAMWDAPADGPEVEFGDHVTDEQYGA